jgi:hypothetical protein
MRVMRASGSGTLFEQGLAGACQHARRDFQRRCWFQAVVAPGSPYGFRRSRNRASRERQPRTRRHLKGGHGREVDFWSMVMS